MKECRFYEALRRKKRQLFLFFETLIKSRHKFLLATFPVDFQIFIKTGKKLLLSNIKLR